MKTNLIVIIGALLCVQSIAADQGSDWEYVPYPFAPYSASIPADDDWIAIVVGPLFPSGIRVIRDTNTVEQFKTDLKNLVDALVEAHTNSLLSTPSKPPFRRLRQHPKR